MTKYRLADNHMIFLYISRTLKIIIVLAELEIPFNVLN